jgi:hypothetical protein
MRTIRYNFALVVLLFAICSSDNGEDSQQFGDNDDYKPSKRGVLYFWCGQNSSLANATDFVAVVDFDSHSATYGKVVKIVTLPSNVSVVSVSGNEPHHSRVSGDWNYYITGGLLSFLNGTDEIFVWQVPQKPINGPQFLYSLDPPGACTDEFVPVGDSQFLVSQMCNEQAGNPGNIVLIDCKHRNFSSHLSNISEFTNFNPHGFDRQSDGTITVTNYIFPATLLAPSIADIVFRDTVMVISNTGHLQETFTMAPFPEKTAGVGTGNGFMDFKYIPKDPYNRGYVCGTNDNQMYLLRQGQPPLHVFDFSYLSGRTDGHGGLSAGIVSYATDGKRMVMSLLMKWVVLMNITDPEHPFVLRHFGWCNATEILNTTFPVTGHPDQRFTYAQLCATGVLPATHYVLWPPGEKRFMVINYFLNFGLSKFAGGRTVHVFKYNDDITDFTYDKKFNPNDFLAGLSASPHSVSYFPTDNQGNLLPPTTSST